MKNTISVELYGRPGNNAVIQMPGRVNCAVAIQADTLMGLVEDATELASQLQLRQGQSDLAEEAAALAERLRDIYSAIEIELTRAGEL